ncbi:flagellar basal body L-ring protein FlgH [Methylopila turkensis]|uniref:Flagellar L-ring protein n=1 Tax=Methylopila turkensis TaxID=1437816 RepID=A0A9W6JLK7_9HYPH|nr:flagellar basal body L-ring protein FlgH [Methylopila turkensis]GLK79427.1 flagellar L-ring protein 1 [Methylopila turkensis]
MTASLRAHALRIAAVSLSAGLLAGCGAADRLASVGKPPSLSAIENPTTQPGYKAVQMPMPEAMPVSYQPNSLWRSGARGFFKDPRARQVGDLLTVRVDITDKAEFENKTKRTRTASEAANVDNVLGYEGYLKKVLPGGVDPQNLVKAGSTTTSEGEGTVDRKETLTTNVAAVVTQVLPNGALVIEGKQEIRVNFEIRELIVAGVVRTEDIDSDNTIASEKIAQARIAYGGRGQLTDVQQPRYGQQVMDVLLPF